MPAVTVIMAVFNGEEFLQEAIDSILHQTLKEFEFIIVNDASTDLTQHILNQITDPRVRVIHLDQNAGPSQARNIAVQHAKGKWIAVQDADDLSHPQRLEKQLHFLETHPNMVAVSCQLKCITGKGEVEDHQLEAIEQWHNQMTTPEKILKYRFQGCPLCHGTVCYSKKVFLEVGGYHPNYRIAEDYELWLKMLEKGFIGMIPEILYHYRVHPSSLSHSNEEETFHKVVEVSTTHLRNHLHRLKGSNPQVALIGPKNACQYFNVFVYPFSGLQVKYLFYQTNENDLAVVHGLYKRKDMDTILILEFEQAWKIAQYFEAQGLRRNQDYFRIWNIFN